MHRATFNVRVSSLPGHFLSRSLKASLDFPASLFDVFSAILQRGRQAKPTEDKMTLNLCIWSIGIQGMLPKHVKALIGPIMELLAFGIESPVRSTTLAAESCTVCFLGDPI